VPAQVRAQWAGAQSGEQMDRRAQPGGRDRDVEGVAAGPGDEVRCRTFRSRVGVRYGQEIDDEFAQDAENGEVTGGLVAAAHGRTLAARVNRWPALAPGAQHLGRWATTSIIGPAAAPEQEDPCPIRS
jgi:hypothetical protein